MCCCCLQITKFLNEFDLSMRYQLAKLNERISSVERSLEFCESSLLGDAPSTTSATSQAPSMQSVAQQKQPDHSAAPAKQQPLADVDVAEMMSSFRKELSAVQSQATAAGKSLSSMTAALPTAMSSTAAIAAQGGGDSRRQSSVTAAAPTSSSSVNHDAPMMTTSAAAAAVVPATGAKTGAPRRPPPPPSLPAPPPGSVRK
jgi:hypothetical protein